MTPEEKEAHKALDAAGVQKTRQGKRLALPERIAMLAAKAERYAEIAGMEYGIRTPAQAKKDWQEWLMEVAKQKAEEAIDDLFEYFQSA